jgi:hypothetical protein
LQAALADCIRYVLEREPNLPRYIDEVRRVAGEGGITDAPVVPYNRE